MNNRIKHIIENPDKYSLNQYEFAKRTGKFIDDKSIIDKKKILHYEEKVYPKGITVYYNGNIYTSNTITSPTFIVDEWDLPESVELLKTISNFEPPDSSAIKVYGNNQANLPIYGRLYHRNDIESVVPDGWRVPTQEEFEKVSTEVNILMGGTYSIVVGWRNINLYGNYWFKNEEATLGYMQYYENNTGSVKGFYNDTATNTNQLMSLLLIKNTTDRVSSDIIKEEIDGKEYNTKLLTDGNIWLFENFAGLKQNPKKRLITHKDKIEWILDVPTPHIHTKNELPFLRDFDIIEDLESYIPPTNTHYIELINSSNQTISKYYRRDSIIGNIPTGWRLPTRNDFKLLAQAAGNVGELKNNAPTPVNVIINLKPSGSTGFNMIFNGWIDILSTPHGIPMSKLLNNKHNPSTFSNSYGVSTIYLCNPENTATTGVRFADTTIYNQYYSYHSNAFSNNRFGVVRLIKTDGILPAGGVANIHGKDYQCVQIGSLVWLAEDYVGPVTAEPYKSLVKRNNSIVWNTDKKQTKVYVVNSTEGTSFSKEMMFVGKINNLQSFVTTKIENITYDIRLDSQTTWTTGQSLTQLQTWIDENVINSSILYWIRVNGSFVSGQTGVAELHFKYFEI